MTFANVVRLLSSAVSSQASVPFYLFLADALIQSTLRVGNPLVVQREVQYVFSEHLDVQYGEAGDQTILLPAEGRSSTCWAPAANVDVKTMFGSSSDIIWTSWHDSKGLKKKWDRVLSEEKKKIPSRF